MPLVKCPDCGHVVSGKAGRCPACGCPISDGSQMLHWVGEQLGCVVRGAVVVLVVLLAGGLVAVIAQLVRGR